MKNHRKDAGHIHDLRALLNDESQTEVRFEKNYFKNNLERDIAASSKTGKKMTRIVEKQPR
ncbi:hypothetical protein [Pantoea cypripedii]|uniref:Uncharacterized protein n=1 Tax=Pantoea cypripedii TaxID=55209 RepID=A0A6B9G9E7_PANCY|nr:hypothetical protein [Pantoea cypripedii]QGY32483.1 hypothetical protein CUN67_26285 [Pantoea cypripedii]